MSSYTIYKCDKNGKIHVTTNVGLNAISMTQLHCEGSKYILINFRLFFLEWKWMKGSATKKL